jgi:hypothetical protein|tara:strand:+ start:274 stop:537 length:264 start_codon:yes stop_codon:yes gene_type:complete
MEEIKKSNVLSLDKAYLKQALRDLASVDVKIRTGALKWLSDKHYLDVIERLEINPNNFAKALKNLLAYPPESRKVLVRDMEKLIDKI